MSVSPSYTLSDQLSYGALFSAVSALLLFCCFGVIHIFMSVNIAERLAFEKRAVHFDRGVFANLIILSSSYIHFEGRSLNLIVSVTCKQLMRPNVLLYW